MIVLFLTQGAVPDKVFASSVPEIIKAIESSYERKKEKEAWKKAMNSTRYGRVAYVGEGRGYFEGPYADELKRMSPEEREKVLKEEEKKQFRIWKKEGFPYVEKIVTACEEYASYFLFWEAYYNSYKDVKRARDLIEETAKRYPEASPGKIAEEILRKAKTEKQLVSLIQEEFKNLPNPVETYTSREGEPENSAMNNLKKAIAPTEEYNKWKDIALLGKYQNLQKEEAMKLACQAIEEIISILDETIASYYYRLAHYCLIAPDQDFNMFRHFLVLIVSRYPHTSRAESAKHNLKVFTKPGID